MDFFMNPSTASGPPPFHKGGSVCANIARKFLCLITNFDYKLRMFYYYPNLNFCTFLEMFLSYQKLDFYKFSNPQKHYFISRKLDLHEPPL